MGNCVYTSSSTSITQDGLLTFTKPGEIVVKATSEENRTVTATYTVRVGGVSNTSSVTFTNDEGGQLEIKDGETLKITLTSKGGVLQTGSIKFAVNVQTNFVPEIEGIDKSYTVVSSNPSIAEVGTNGTIAVLGEGEFTITVSFNSYDIQLEQKFVVVVEVVEYDCIKDELPNVGTYLYKVGNQNSFDITKLWKFTGEEASVFEKEGIIIGYNIVNADGSGKLVEGEGSDYTLNGNMLKFNGFQGVVKLQVTAMDSDTKNIVDSETIPLEVLDGYNVTTENDLFTLSNTSNKMILNDITLTQYRSNGTHVVNGSTLYGNGFTLDGSKATHPSEMMWYALVSVQDAVVDNINVIGKIFPEITWSNGAYSAYTLYLSDNSGDQSDTCEVYNSYFYGSRSPICVQAISYVYNTVFEGGVLANIVVENDVTLSDVTTIQNIASDNIGDITEDNIDELGIGLGVFVESTFANNVTISLEGDFLQYNWIDSGLINNVDPVYGAILSTMLSKYPEFIHIINDGEADKEFVNAGIVFQSAIQDGKQPIIDNRNNKEQYPYMFNTDKGLDVGGAIFTLANGLTGSKEDQVASGDKIVADNRFDSNLHVGNIVLVNTKPYISIDTSFINENYSPSFSFDELTVDLSKEGYETFSFTSDLFMQMFSASHYGNDISATISFAVPTDRVDENGNRVYEKVEEIFVDENSSRTINFAVAVNTSGYYDANGNFVMEKNTYYYDLKLVSTLPIPDATFSDNRLDSVVYHFYAPIIENEVCGVTTYDYELAAYLLEGLSIQDYVNGEKVTIDFSGMTELPEKLTIKSFTVGATGATSYRLVIYDSKLLFIGGKASPDKRTETLSIVFSYEGANGNKVEFTRKYQFTQDTTEFDVNGVM